MSEFILYSWVLDGTIQLTNDPVRKVIPMLSLIEVQCPHCGARGQIMIPPVGSIIIGPCPQCEELVVVFCGHVLPLDKQLMESGTVDDRRDHLLTALTGFLHERVHRLLLGETLAEGELVEEGFIGPIDDPTEPSSESAEQSPITETEMERFTDVDLKLLDNTAYFRSVFEQN